VASGRSRFRTHASAYLGLAALLLIAGVDAVRDARDRIDEILHGAELARHPFSLDSVTLAISGLTPEAQAAGLRDGDVLRAVNGRPLRGLSDFAGPVRQARVRDRLDVRVRSAAADGAVEKDVSIQLGPFTYLGFAKGESAAYYYTELLTIAMPVVCLALGFWVAAVRVTDSAAWWLLVLMLSFACFISSDRTIYGNLDALQPLLTAFRVLFASMGAAALALFGLAFPEPLGVDRRWPWIKWILFGPLIALGVTNALFVSLSMHHHVSAVALAGVLRPFARLSVLSLVAVATFFLALGYKGMTASNRDARRRLLLLAAGTVTGVTPIAVLLFLQATRGVRFQGWIAVVPVMTLLILPLTMAYVIVVRRAMDVRVVIRQGLQYLLATGGVRVLQIAISVAIVITAATMSAGSHAPARIALISVGFALLLGVSGFAQRLREWIDRRFFREAYEADAILIDLAARVRMMLETRPLLETVAGRIAASLHVSRIAILLDDRGAFRPTYAVGYASPFSGSLASHGATVAQLGREPHVIVDFEDGDSWVQGTDSEERASLAELRPDLLLPMAINERLVGIMSLGPKQSEEPYSGTDLRLLESVSAQTALALENGRLTEAIKAEVAAREKLRREMELAHEVQERLFPQTCPAVAGLDYAGACRQARGVGGDYYDFIALSPQELGIAIGDVSGKGIPAALLMATLRAYLHGQTIHRELDLTALVGNLNTLVYESSADNRYATFFYAEWDAGARALRYVNAGHNSPMVFRTGPSGEVVCLVAGGPVVGLMERCGYQQGSLALEPGDVLVAYTDGISEAMNPAGEEWGEQRLIETVRENRCETARVLIDRIMAAADAFVGGAAQHDDMTLVVVRIV